MFILVKWDQDYDAGAIPAHVQAVDVRVDSTAHPEDPPSVGLEQQPVQYPDAAEGAHTAPEAALPASVQHSEQGPHEDPVPTEDNGG